MAKRRFSRVRSFYTKKKHHKKSSSMGLGSLTPIIAGIGAGVALSFAAPYINRYIPSNVAGIPNTAIAAVILGAGTKILLKKDPMKIPTSLMVLGGSMIGASLLSGNGGAVGAGVGAYANDL